MSERVLSGREFGWAVQESAHVAQTGANFAEGGEGRPQRYIFPKPLYLERYVYLWYSFTIVNRHGSGDGWSSDIFLRAVEWCVP